MVNPYPDLSDVEFERYFNFACIWAFAGTLHVDHRETFSQWWRESFEQHIDYPEEGTVSNPGYMLLFTKSKISNTLVLSVSALICSMYAFVSENTWYNDSHESPDI